MVHIAKEQPTRQPYASPLREEQARQTRERILDGLIRTMAMGIADLSIPAVAREAGVSVPTVYRHFASKRELVAAIGPYAIAKGQFQPERPVENLDELSALVRPMLERHEQMDPILRAAMASQLGQEVRRANMPERRHAVRHVLMRELPGLGDEDLDGLTDIVVILLSSATARAFRDYLGLGAEPAAERLTRALRFLVDGARAVQEG